MIKSTPVAASLDENPPTKKDAVQWDKEVAMRSEQPVRCAKCYLRMESYELRTVHYKTTYHQHCFLLLLREKTEQEKVKQAELTGAARSKSA